MLSPGRSSTFQKRKYFFLNASKSMVSVDHRPALGQNRPLAVDLVLAPEAGGVVDVDEDAVLAVGHVDRQPARLDADEVLVERIGLEGIEGPPDLARSSARSRGPCCRSCPA